MHRCRLSRCWLLAHYPNSSETPIPYTSVIPVLALHAPLNCNAEAVQERLPMMRISLRTSNAIRPRHRSKSSLIAATCLACLFVFPSHRVDAQDAKFWFGYGSQYPRRALSVHRPALPPKRAREVDDQGDLRKGDGRGASTEPIVNRPLFAVLSLSNQHISVYNSTGKTARFKVSTGMPGHRTPTGIFTIIDRERWHRSNLYSGAPMPFMQRITWSGVALHAGVVPGYPASHGCIRLPASSAERLWGMTKIGERVVISPHEVAPTTIAHPMLPVPKMQPTPELLSESASGRIIEVATMTSEPLPIVGTRSLNPIEYAQALKVRAAKDAASAAKTVKELSDRTGPTSEAVRRALAELRRAEVIHAQAESNLAAKARALAAAKRPAAREAAAVAKTAAEAHLMETAKRLEEASASKVLEMPEAREALSADRTLKEARAALAQAQTAAKEAVRRAKPVSILVSKKDNRVYIRQGLAPVLDAPAIIRDPETPLGTHLYIATSQSEGVTLGWSVVSLPSSINLEEPPQRRSRDMREERHKGSERHPAASNPAQALERIEFPKEISERISELLWIGGSLIITDQPLSSETSDVGTDLVVTTR